MAALLAGFVDAIVGGGGLILVPAAAAALIGSFWGAWTVTLVSADGLRKALPPAAWSARASR